MNDAATTSVTDCLFCRIAHRKLEVVVLHEDADLMAFLDIAPIRTGHTQIIPKAHVATFELLAPALAGRMIVLGQQFAQRMKAVYAVDRVAFLFTGGDVAHAHAHVVPMHEKTDITSARYIVHPKEVTWGSSHLQADRATLLRVKDELAGHHTKELPQ
jgi:histidine triad (HIT) family protein